MYMYTYVRICRYEYVYIYICSRTNIYMYKWEESSKSTIQNSLNV